MREYIELFFNDFTVSLSFFLIEVLTVRSSSSAVSVILVGEEVASVWENLGWLFIPDFLPFLFPSWRLSSRYL